jgi:hypothetical protein
MATKRHKSSKKNKTLKMRSGRKWVTAIEAASKTLTNTGSIVAARQSLRKQALYNARKMFGSI